MPITQQFFCNASIRNFTCSIGWGTQSSSLTVNLVEDPTLEQAFTPPSAGLPAYFSYDSFAFGGLVQSYKRKNSPQGYPVFEITLTDPRDILEGVQIIIDGYNGTIGNMPNLFNVYGYLENISFGYAETNDNGILTSKLILGIEALIGASVLTTPINYLGANYYLDLSSLPNLPEFHRMGGGVSMSLMDIISRICEDGACDFFVTLYRGAFSENIIKVHTISRLTQPAFGMINAFINANTHGEAVENEVGLESRNEVVGKFLVGGNVTAMYYQFPDDGPLAAFDDDTILQWWGVDANGSPVIQEAFEDDNPKFTLDSRTVNVIGVGATYTTDVEEMRAALGGQVAWEIFINSKNATVGSPHFGKAAAIGMPAQQLLEPILAQIPQNGFDNFAHAQRVLQPFDFNLLAAFTGRHVNRMDRGDKHQENITRLFQYVSDFANEYYGKKFMVRILDIQAHIESETGRIITNMEPTEGGYIDEADFPVAIGNKLVPNDYIKIVTDDGRLQAYVRFDDADTLDLSEIQPDDYILEANSVYIKCEVDPIIYVLDLVTLESPRVIITLPGRVYGADNRNDFAGALKDILGPRMRLEAADQKRLFGILLAKWGADKLMLGKGGLAILPDMAAIPLKSNVLTYGPWQAFGANGKIEFEQNNELVPWEYGGFTQLNIVGNALVSDAIAGQVRAETGSITIPGGPNNNIGSELIAGGPYITSVNVDIGENGVTSTYRMETWTPRFGKMAKLNAERMAKLAKENVIRKREMRKLNRLARPDAAFFKARAGAVKELDAPPRAAARTSSLYIGGQIHKLDGVETRRNDVAILPEYNAFAPLSSDYANKAFMSLDGLFRPFSTKKTDTGVPHYEEPTEGSEKTVDDLDPFQDGNDISVVASDTALQEDVHISDLTSPDKRPIALRGPLVVCGPGYDTNGKPVPNATPDNPGDEFLTDYLTRSDMHKVGPVDLRWDNSRKVWAAGLGANIRVIKMAQDLYYGATGSGILMDMTWNGTIGSSITLTESSEVVTVAEVLGYTYYDVIAVSNTKYVLAIESNEVGGLYILESAFLE